MIKWILNVFKPSEIQDVETIKPLPLTNVDKFFMKLQKPLNNLMSFIKDTYSFDTVTYYSFHQPFSDYSKKYRIILENAFNNILGESDVSSSLEKLTEFQFIECSRYYDNIHKTFYLLIYHFYDSDGTLRIIIDEELENNLGFLRIPLIHLNGAIGLKCRSFLEYREIYDEYSSEVPVFRTLDSVFSKVIPVRKTSPILDIYEYPYYEYDYPSYEYSEADFIIKKYFDQCGVEYCLFELRYANKIIKSKIIKIENLLIDIGKEVDDFLFPLLEKPELLDAINLVPKLSVEFMSQDFSDFIAVKNMEAI